MAVLVWIWLLSAASHFTPKIKIEKTMVNQINGIVLVRGWEGDHVCCGQNRDVQPPCRPPASQRQELT